MHCRQSGSACRACNAGACLPGMWQHQTATLLPAASGHAQPGWTCSSRAQRPGLLSTCPQCSAAARWHLSRRLARGVPACTDRHVLDTQLLICCRCCLQAVKSAAGQTPPKGPHAQQAPTEPACCLFWTLARRAPVCPHLQGCTLLPTAARRCLPQVGSFSNLHCYL